ncbi:MAG: hypothetical protein QOI66_2189, partial [Myxococcales bacterium]|nr:hypothetical protein [Myxococcales bacterium]
MAEVCRPPYCVLVISLALGACTASLPTNSVPSGGGGNAGGAAGGTSGASGAAGGSGGIGASTGGAGGDGSGGAPAGSGGSGPLTDGRPNADGSDGNAGIDGPSGMPGACAAMFCDDFESYATGGPPGGNWKAALQRGMLAVDATKAFSGERSVHFTHQGAPAMMFIEL